MTLTATLLKRGYTHRACNYRQREILRGEVVVFRGTAEETWQWLRDRGELFIVAQCSSCDETLADVEERGRDVCLCLTQDADLVEDINRALADRYFDREAEARHERYEAEAGR